MADSKEFEVIRIARSDGADTGPEYWPVTSSTVKKSAKDTVTADKTPRAKPQMSRLAEDDPRFMEWRVKLGILLKQELSPNPDEGHPWYVQFPRGYWLYEKSKHLWVSGYPIKAKLFKSPQEFGLHLIWLLSTSKEYRDCCCVHCNAPTVSKLASEVEESLVIKPAEAPAKVEKLLPRVTPVPLPPIPGQPPSKQAATAPRQQLTPTVTSASPAPKTISPVPPPVVPTAVPKASTPQAQARAQPTPLAPQPQAQLQAKPPAKSQAQPQLQPQLQPQVQAQPHPQAQPQVQPQVQTQPHPQAQPQARPQPQPANWSLQSSLLFRTGDLVWYQNGNTWRLGVIAASRPGNYEVLPIGHGMAPHQNVTKVDTDMRPFHAFSVPPVAISELKDKTFDSVNWEAMLRATGNDAAKRDHLILDASKMAASKIDSSYSLWSPVAEDPNNKSVSYYGCFFGAERIEIGDTLRLKPPPMDLNNTIPDTAVMGLRQILASKDFARPVYFRGHLYHLSKGDGSGPAGNAVPEENLPIALRDEIQWRNQVNPAQRWRYTLLSENVVVEEQAIKGRFYPTHRLMPVLNPAGFRAVVSQGQLDEQHPYLNTRMDGATRYIGRTVNRTDTLGAAVPHDARLALEPPIREEGFDMRA